MSKLREIKVERDEYLKMSDIPRFAETVNHSGLAKAGIYLFSSTPCHKPVNLTWALLQFPKPTRPVRRLSSQ